MSEVTEIISTINKRFTDHGEKVPQRTFATIKCFDSDKQKIKEVFTALMTESDRSISKLQWLPEYDQVIDWLADSKGQQLCLMGAKGRGKTNIVMHVIPKIFKYYGFVVKTIPCTSLHNLTVFELAMSSRYLALDEVGIEKEANNYGVTFEPFIDVMNVYENNNGVLMFSTNLTMNMIKERYGSRVLDRMKRYKIVEFKGNSLR